MSVSYFQVGGFHPQIQWFKSTYDNRQLAECIAGPASLLRSQTNPDEPVELVLGIKRSGSSHLLLTADKAYQLSRALRLPDPRSPFRANEFESLSPIHFASAEALSKKLSELKPKAGARGDTSQANRGYDEFQDDLYRAAFEHGRVIYRVLNETIDAQTYGLDDTSWSQNLRISAMVFNTKGLDDRRTEERIKNPLVLDVGFCDAESPTLEPDARKTSHIINAANSLLGRKQRKLPFVHGNTETVPGSEMPTRIQALFKNHVHPTDQPMILLVYKEVETMNYLRNMGVDISSWRFGLGDLLVMDRSTVSLPS
ncbi:hypothetical protein B0H34DRAFT_665187 [Crassisporium funariophilum]|nr:hypothetical protein B0H34DRAFT_665187 [Crassisporium funariophilum]